MTQSLTRLKHKSVASQLKNLLFLTLVSLSFISHPTAVAQRVASVSGKYTYILSENDDVTIKEAKLKAIEQAKAEALKNEF